MFKLIEVFNAVIRVNDETTITLRDCSSYMEAYELLTEYLSDRDEQNWDCGESYFKIDYAKIEKKFIRF